MEIIMWFVGVAWRLVLISIGFWLCWLLLTKGRGRLKEVLGDIFHTLGLIAEAIGCFIRKKLIGFIRKEKEEPEEEETPDSEMEADAAMRTILKEDVYKVYKAWKSMPNNPKN